MHPYRRLRVAMASAPGTAACAACRVLRRKCTAQCLFAPYFPPDQPQKFAHVHKVFGVANVTKMLHELPPPHREDCVNSLAYEADARVQDPVYGCVGAISVLQQQVAHLQTQLTMATSEIGRLRETFAIAAAASCHNSVLSTTNGNGNPPVTVGSCGAILMAALQPSSRSSPPPPQCPDSTTALTISSPDHSQPCQDFLRPAPSTTPTPTPTPTPTATATPSNKIIIATITNNNSKLNQNTTTAFSKPDTTIIPSLNEFKQAPI